MNHIIFSHGNGFPASTYRSFTNDLNRRGFQVASIEKFGHDARYPVLPKKPIGLALSARAESANHAANTGLTLKRSLSTFSTNVHLRIGIPMHSETMQNLEL